MVKVSDLANEIVNQLKQYTEEVEQEVKTIKDEVSKEAVQELRSLKKPKLTGDYANGWARKKVGADFVIHNRTDYHLTHLLEYGHAKAGGGRVAAIPHIRPIEEQVVNEYVDRVEKAVQS